MTSLEGKVAVVTGAGSGIGRALAIELTRRGARVALSDIDGAAAEETRTLCAGAEARAYKLDVSSAEDFAAHAQQVLEDFGTVHLVFNNAGATLIGTLDHTELDEIDWLLGINLRGVVVGSKAFLPTMLAQREGWIVNISSILGLAGYPGQSAYNISKFGVRGLTEALWSELAGTGVRAVLVHPGGIQTNIERAGRRTVNAGEAEVAITAAAVKMLVTPPEVVASDILDGIERGRRRILTGKYSRSIFWLSRALPNRFPAVLARLG
ncbi:SDR family oxidoreductase [Nocardioides caeni]|uniref:SDR family oxidoreductase n=1 Tax=Nocardioides caeni TaxID=574700 RepID=A0A4S8NJ63_9ACTN|nr:SDR family oxidoreductase [Nocardioides caeni]THV16012.1 SDR family oxidoreductase [Nocardioides caeni]